METLRKSLKSSSLKIEELHSNAQFQNVKEKLILYLGFPRIWIRTMLQFVLNIYALKRNQKDKKRIEIK
jgi:hypothetical protein